MRFPGDLTRRQFALLAIFGCAGLLLMVQFWRPPTSNLWAQVFFNTMHWPVFSAVTMLAYIATLAIPAMATARRLGTAVAVSLALGAVSELAQLFVERDASLADFGTDALGVAVAMLSIVSVSSAVTRHRGVRRSAGALAVCIAILGLWPAFRVSAAYLVRNDMKPVLYEFDGRSSPLFLKVLNATLTVDKGRYTDRSVGKLTFAGGDWPALVVTDVWPKWDGYSNLVIGIENSGDKPVRLYVRVHDRQHLLGDEPSDDRFTAAFLLNPGLHRIPISIDRIRNAPAGRSMDMDDIHAVVLFGDRNVSGATFSVVELRLE